jgi:hypothetical protein
MQGPLLQCVLLYKRIVYTCNEGLRRDTWLSRIEMVPRTGNCKGAVFLLIQKIIRSESIADSCKL